MEGKLITIRNSDILNIVNILAWQILCALHIHCNQFICLNISEPIKKPLQSDKNFAFSPNTLKILRPYGTLLDLGVIFNSTAIMPRWGSPVRDKILVEKMYEIGASPVEPAPICRGTKLEICRTVLK